MKLLSKARHYYWLVVIGVLGLAVLVGIFLFNTNIWGTWGEPMSWSVGLAIQILILLKGLEYLKSTVSTMDKKTFEVTLGLRKGYESSADVFDGVEVVQAIKEWMEIRSNAGLKNLQGKFVYGEGIGLIYPMRNGIAVDQPETAADEPLFLFTGELSPKYDAGRSDDEVKLTLRDLALFLGRKFSQKRMYYSYKGVQYAEDVH